MGNENIEREIERDKPEIHKIQFIAIAIILLRIDDWGNYVC